MKVFFEMNELFKEDNKYIYLKWMNELYGHAKFNDQIFGNWWH